MQIVVLLLTIGGGIYFLLFKPDSQVSLILMALMPLGWLGLFSLRYFAERKKRKVEALEDGTFGLKKEKKKFRDPSEFLEEETR